MQDIWDMAKIWLGLEKMDDPTPWTHLIFGVVAGLILALIALVWRGSTLAIVMLAGFIVLGVVNEWQARRAIRSNT